MRRRSFLASVAAVPSLGLAVMTGATSDADGAPKPTDRERARATVPKTILLVDDRHVLYRPATKRVLRPLDRHADNPLVKAKEKPWEVAIAWNSVQRNPATGSYQLWYQAYSGRKARKKTHACVVCYAESQDGIHWTKPDLGIHRYNDSNKTNIVLVGNGGHSVRYGASVAIDPRDLDPARRYKMAYFDFAMDRGHEYPGLNVAFSPDGIQWAKYAQAPLLRAAYGQRGCELPFADETDKPWLVPLSVSDALDVLYDPRRHVFAIYGKMWIDGPDGRMFWKHAMQRTESRDFVHWSRPELVLAPDEFDPEYVEFHTAPVFFYNNTYFALLQILNRAERGGVMDIELALSRDGLRWERPFRDRFFLPKNPAGGFDGGSIFNNTTCIVHGDELWFYYGGYSQGATGANDYSQESGIGLATMPRDRFAAITPRDRVGQVTLKPLPLSSCNHVSLNAVAQDGAVRTEVLDCTGRRIRGFTAADAVPVRGDALNHRVAWREKKLGDLAAGDYMLRLHLDGAAVYALTLH